jgi:hypothetical protein
MGMFNQFTPAEVVFIIGQTLLRSARRTEDLDAFSKGQLFSAASTCRHLSVEIQMYPLELRKFSHDVASAINAGIPDQNEATAKLVKELSGAIDSITVGRCTAELLEILNVQNSQASREARVAIRSMMKNLTLREVDLLAAEIEPDTKQTSSHNVERKSS